MSMLGNIAAPSTNATVAPDDNHNEVTTESSKEGAENVSIGTESENVEESTVVKQEESSDDGAGEEDDAGQPSYPKV
ncbi:unnamed protein product [Acanthoscelides obtectus]|uniref:Uncharacterized protein n=1 Tax=Acanthoscelides obtectus TaxID=200917 RepID=A0A9P0PLU1_ACAOB|nr:unnamed protein product [Acanthoscelides obtectus]CAK1662487.1 hypothetical protein AOBTE_LOCUS23169 [Acanthoscelides obtectus]